MEVTEASPNVRLNSNGDVKLEDGDSLSAVWNHRIAGKRTLMASVAGNGSLTVARNETTVTAFDGPVTDGAFAYSGDSGLERLSFSFAGAGSATVCLDEDRPGLTLIVR